MKLWLHLCNQIFFFFTITSFNLFIYIIIFVKFNVFLLLDNHAKFSKIEILPECAKVYFRVISVFECACDWVVEYLKDEKLLEAEILYFD